MDIYLLDREFQTVCILDGFSSLLWNRRYKAPGDFQLVTTDPKYFALAKSAKYIYRPDAAEVGLIESVGFTQDESNLEMVTIKGRFLEALLYRRVISKTVTLKGTVEEVCRQLVSDICINDQQRKIDNLELGQLAGLGSVIDTQSTGDNLSEKLYELEAVEDLSHRIKYDFLTNRLQFEIWKGLDRTDDQSENPIAIFSSNFENVVNLEYSVDEAEYRNFAYVAGEGEGPERIVAEVDCTNGEERREVYIDARDLQKKRVDQEDLTDQEYQALLYQRGLEKLQDYKRIEVFNSNIDHQSNLIYKKDFDLGDLCIYVNHKIQLSTNKRITEIDEAYEGTSLTVTIIFGDDYKSITEKIKRGG